MTSDKHVLTELSTLDHMSHNEHKKFINNIQNLQYQDPINTQSNLADNYNLKEQTPIKIPGVYEISCRPTNCNRS